MSNFSGSKLDYLMYRIHREFGKTSSIQIIIVAILIHSFISIFMIYIHLVYYNDTYHSKHSVLHSHPNKGLIAIVSRSVTNEDIDSEIRYRLGSNLNHEDRSIYGPNGVNFLSSKLIDSSELTHIGWFSDHFRWDESIQCFNNRWTLCDKIFIAKCKQDTIRAIYQFVPFKSEAKVRNVFISLRATAEQLVEQSSDAFYGLMALVEFQDGTNELLKLKFQYESEAWSLRTLNYNAPSSKPPFSSITIMLACFGYSGVASFTDVRLTTENAGIDPIFSPQEICSWCTKVVPNFYQNSRLSSSHTKDTKDEDRFEILVLPSSPDSQRLSKQQLTLVTQVSMDRLTVLERSLQTWTGPVSIAIYVSIKPDQGTAKIQDWQRLYINKKIQTLNISTPLSTIFMVPFLESDNLYPINYLRNLAIKMVKTRFMFLIDADFQPSPNLEQNFFQFLHRYHHFDKFQEKIPTDEEKNFSKKLAFVVPAFEYLETPNKDDPILKSKDELIQLIHREDPMLQPFRFYESSEAHSLTNYWKWYYTSEPYNISIKFHDKYEPYIIVEKTDHLPLYNEKLTNYGMNKVMHITELFAANFHFEVLANVWAIHFPHRSTAYYQDFLQNLEQRLRNRAQRFLVLEQIIHQYGIRLKECQ